MVVVNNVLAAAGHWVLVSQGGVWRVVMAVQTGSFFSRPRSLVVQRIPHPGTRSAPTLRT